jgi:hypothetical protein
VVAVLGPVRLLDVVVVLGEVGIPLVGLAADEPVEAVVPQPERPVLLRRAIVQASTGVLWFLPTQNVLQPALRRTVAIVAFSRRMCEL